MYGLGVVFGGLGFRLWAWRMRFSLGWGTVSSGASHKQAPYKNVAYIYIYIYTYIYIHIYICTYIKICSIYMYSYISISI